eukprot:XP_001704699.1 Hypothetical protein GL50803_11148 [Giardia lamblia ATCC 50803]
MRIRQIPACSDPDPTHNENLTWNELVAVRHKQQMVTFFHGLLPQNLTC